MINKVQVILFIIICLHINSIEFRYTFFHNIFQKNKVKVRKILIPIDKRTFYGAILSLLRLLSGFFSRMANIPAITNNANAGIANH